MTDPDGRPLLADIRQEFEALVAGFREMAAARWELARLELEADLRSVKRLAIICVIAGVMAIVALPLLVVCLAEVLDGYGNIFTAGWLLIFGVGLLSVSAALAAVAVGRFRRRFVGLQETLEEFREDLLWMREKRGGGASESKPENLET